MTKQVGHRLSVVGSANGLGKDHGDIDTLQRQQEQLLSLWCQVRRNEGNEVGERGENPRAESPRDARDFVAAGMG